MIDTKSDDEKALLDTPEKAFNRIIDDHNHGLPVNRTVADYEEDIDVIRKALKREPVDLENLKKQIIRLVSNEQAHYELRSNSSIVRYTIDHLRERGLI